MKSGFVYIWFDRKHKRYYIGAHWGKEDDGYICSSRWMRNSYRRRPSDFKRRIIARVKDRGNLLAEEYKWLSLICDVELGCKYYNLTKHHNGHWTTDEEKRLSVGQKISKSSRGVSRNKGSKRTEEQKQKLRESNAIQFSNVAQRESRRIKIAELWKDPTYRTNQTEKRKQPRPWMIGRTFSEDTKRKMSESARRRKKNKSDK